LNRLGKFLSKREIATSVSALVSRRIDKFSIDRLVRRLHRLDYKVDVVVRQEPRWCSSQAMAASLERDGFELNG
jgi:hypothetical protein